MAKMITQFIFSYVGLFIILCIYCFLGAMLFQTLEGGQLWDWLVEGQQKARYIEQLRAELKQKLKNMPRNYDADYNGTSFMQIRLGYTQPLICVGGTEGLYTMEQFPLVISCLLMAPSAHSASNGIQNYYNKHGYVHDLIDHYHLEVARAIKYYGYDGTVPEKLDYSWSLPHAVLFTMSIVTLIGYGNIAPATQFGRIVMIVYAILGVPVTLMFIANIGDAFQQVLRFIYDRIMCAACRHRRKKEYAVRNPQKNRGNRGGRPDEPAEIVVAGGSSSSNSNVVDEEGDKDDALNREMGGELNDTIDNEMEEGGNQDEDQDDDEEEYFDENNPPSLQVRQIDLGFELE